MGCLGGWWGFQCAAIEARVHDFAIGLDFGAFAIEDTHDFLCKRGSVVGVKEKNKSQQQGELL